MKSRERRSNAPDVRGAWESNDNSAPPVTASEASECSGPFGPGGRTRERKGLAMRFPFRPKPAGVNPGAASDDVIRGDGDER